MRAPFPYFGGKSRAAALVWETFGRDVANYVEPFCGSAAVLLSRPGGEGRIETVNDADGFVANFWRAMALDAEAVAHHADWPVNEADLHARHLWLLGERDRMTERLMGDASWCDAKVAGWWVWGACSWIGSGWCSGEGPWRSVDGVLSLSNGGQGINRQLPHLSNGGQGINRQLPHLTSGRGINRKLPHLGDAGREWATAIHARMRRVRVACGDWRRVVGESVTVMLGTTGVFLDPPYEEGQGYTVQRDGIAAEVWAWAIEAGEDDRYRIAVCGYDDGRTVPDGWREVAWRAAGGYGGGRGNAADDNSGRERIWFSPACNDNSQMGLGI